MLPEKKTERGPGDRERSAMVGLTDCVPDQHHDAHIAVHWGARVAVAQIAEPVAMQQILMLHIAEHEAQAIRSRWQAGHALSAPIRIGTRTTI